MMNETKKKQRKEPIEINIHNISAKISSENKENSVWPVLGNSDHEVKCASYNTRRKNPTGQEEELKRSKGLLKTISKMTVQNSEEKANESPKATDQEDNEATKRKNKMAYLEEKIAL